MGHPVLMRRADPVGDPTAPEIRTLVADMVETMAAARGIGIAAPQIKVPLRVVVFGVPAERVTDASGDGPMPLTAIINPSFEPLGPELELGWEGCLSLPGMRGVVPRYTRVRYTGVTPEGAAIDRVAAGYHARVVQHEFDHLDGILYPMRMPDMSLFGYVEDMTGEPCATED
jgi:peptide deformylase